MTAGRFHLPSTRVLEAVVSLLIVGVVGAFLQPVFVQASGDRNRFCVENARDIVLAVQQYMQDYDESLPPTAIWNDSVAFKRIITPYVRTSRVFRCPATGAGYVTNPSIAGGQGYVLDRETTEVIRDSKAHPDGKLTVAFLDGRVERGGIEQFLPTVDAACVERLRQTSLALAQYAQDYDALLPFQKDDRGFRSAIGPYLYSSRYVKCPDSGQFYTISPDFRGLSLSVFPEPEKVVTFQDPVRHRSRVTTTAFLDGHVVQIGPRGIVYPGPADNAMTSTSNMKQLGLAMLQYAQDYDEHLPPMDTLDHFKTATFDYVRSHRVYVAPGNKPFQLNASLSGESLANIPQPAATAWIQDTNDYRDGKIGTGYVDGHVVRAAP